MGDAAPQQPTQTTSYQLSPEQRQLMNLAMPGVQQFAANVPQQYQGETVAGFTAPQAEAQRYLTETAAPAQARVAGTAEGTYQTLANTLMPGANIPGFRGVANPWEGLAQADPALQSYIEAAQRPTWQALTEQALPAIRGGAITAGGFGGSRQGIAEGLATGRAAQAAGDIATKMAGDRYATNVGALQARYATNVQAEQARLELENRARQGDVNAQLQLLQLTPTVQGAQVAPALTTGAVGDVQQQMEQARINEAIQRSNYSQFAPFLQSKDILSLVQGLPGGSTVSTGNVPQANPWLQALGGASAGTAIGSTFGPAGAGVGALGGAALPFLFR
jgi:hypothetical protein